MAIMKDRRIVFVDGKYKITPLHWKVQQANRKWTDVFLRFVGGVPVWSCCAVSEGWGCVFFKGDASWPFCSHTKAAQLWLKKKGVKT